MFFVAGECNSQMTIQIETLCCIGNYCESSGSIETTQLQIMFTNYFMRSGSWPVMAGAFQSRSESLMPDLERM
jgi:hypothetical protein